MPVTPRPQDKFAFLFTGPTDQRFQKDLLNIYVTLTEFYNYPASNIWVVWGGPNNLSASFLGAHTTSISTPAELSTQYTAFAAAVEANIPDSTITNSKNVALIYITGIGNDATGGPFGTPPDLVIKPGSPDVTMTSLELKNMLLATPFSQSHINLIMQQDFANSFTADLYNMGISSNDKTVTCVNGSQTSSGDVDGGNFTKGWISALRQIDTVNVSGVPTYADELPYASEPYLVALEQAKEFAQIMKSPEIYNFSSQGETALPGKPSFLIRDGDNTVGFWESPDIYLTHPNDTLHPGKTDDLFKTDATGASPPFNNTINVVFRNIGTHPVRCYTLGIKVYRTPFDITSDTLTQTGRKPAGLVLKPTFQSGYNVFSNNNTETYSWPTPFYTGTTHQCLWAKVYLPLPVGTQFDFAWNVIVNDNEAQRNTDPGSDPPKGGSKPKAGDQFRGNKKHKYFIHNPFRETYQFMITTLPEYQKSLNSVEMNWFVIGNDNKWKRIKPEKIEKGFNAISFILKGGETKSFLGEFGFKAGAKGKFRLPMEILIDKKSGSDSRIPAAPSLREKFAAISGFTIILTYEPADIICMVVDKKGNPDQTAIVHIQTINGLQKESIPVNKNGELILKAINPDVYRMKATAKSGESIDQIIQLSGGETARVKLTIVSRPLKALNKR